MFELIGFLKYVLAQGAGLVIAVVTAGIFIYIVLRKLHSRKATLLLTAFFVGIFLFFFVPQGLPGLNLPFSLTKTFGPADGPQLPLKNILTFFKNFDELERVADIAQDPNNIPPPITRTWPETVKVEMEAREVISEIAPGVTVNYWTFDGRVPGPFLRVREGDTVELTLKNSPSSLHHHNIDLHAVTGPGGGATITNVAPGESKIAIFKALNPGLYVYHCAHPNVPNHMTHGMYGLILVQPKEGLPEVDKEFYVMQGEFYTTGPLGKKGLQMFDSRAMLDGIPSYMFFNGRVKALVGNMNVKVGDTVRMYVGNGGVNLISSFHVIGEIFDRVYPEAAIGSEPHTNIQTTAVPAGGASIVEFGLEVPGEYILVDHALARLDKGLWGIMDVEGEDAPEIFRSGVIEHEEDGHTH